MPAFILALLSFLALEFGALILKPHHVKAESSSDVFHIVANKSLDRRPGLGYAYFNLHPNSRLRVLEDNKLQVSAPNYKQCLVGCAANRTCFSINFGRQPIFFFQGKAHYLCELLATDKYKSSSMYQNNDTGFDHYSIRTHCSKSPCLYNFTCIPLYNHDTYDCSCPRPAYEGRDCKDVDECTTGQHNCSVNAHCINTIGSFNCTCRVGYHGNGRECTDINECASNPCQSGGTCQDQVNSYTCTCAAGFTGVNCQKNIDECASNPCQNGGTCQDQVNSYTCTCAAGFTGVNCQTDINECASNPCENGGTCKEDQVNSYTCSCAAGFEGVNCHIDWLKVASAVCIGTRNNQFGSFTIPAAYQILNFKLVYVSGGGIKLNSLASFAYWGNSFESNRELNFHITDTSNARISPPASFPVNTQYGFMSYKLPGVTNMDPQITLPELSPPLSVTAGKAFRIWFDQDLRDIYENDNQGQTCADVWIRKQSL